MDYSVEIEKLYKLAKKFKGVTLTTFSQVGEVYDPKKWGNSRQPKIDNRQ